MPTGDPEGVDLDVADEAVTRHWIHAEGGVRFLPQVQT